MPDPWRIFRIPMLLAVLNAVGLFAALLADGVGDLVSWLAFGVVAWVALAYRKNMPRKPPRHLPPQTRAR